MRLVLALALGALAPAPAVVSTAVPPGAALARAAGGPERDAAGQALDERLDALGSSDVARWSAAFEALAREGERSVARALETLDEAGVQGARSRARLVAEAGGPDAIPAVLAALAHPDPEVRRELATFLGGFALGESRADERLAALARLAREDASPSVRRGALRALARSGLPRAAEALDELIDELPRAERALAVESLIACPRADARIVARTLAAFRAPLAESDAPSTARLLRAFGQALADLPQGGGVALERRPLIAGRRHPDERVRGAALDALDGALARLVELGEPERADQLLDALGREGLDAREALYRRASLALSVRGAPEDAARLAAELARASGGAEAVDRTWRFYAEHFAAAADLALGRPREAYAGFAAAAGTMRGLVAERDDLRPAIVTRSEHPLAPTGGAVIVDRLQLVALEELWQALARCEAAAADGAWESGGAATSDDAAGARAGESAGESAGADGAEPAAPVDARALEHLREAHRLVLEAQRFALARDADFPVSHTLDDLLERELSPHRLVLANRELHGWRNGSGIDLALLLARALACVAPREMPGFEPAVALAPGPLSDPFQDDERFALLVAVHAEDLESARRAWLYERGRLFERSRAENDPELVDRAALLGHPMRLRLLEAQRRDQALDERVRSADPERLADPAARRALHAELEDHRPPSEHALTLAAELRIDGRAAEARALSERMLAAVRGGLSGANVISTEILSARIELSISSSYTDEDRPAEAEREALSAAKRLQAFENTIEERISEERDPDVRTRMERSLRQVQRMRSGALLSLAVNANVRMHDPARALAYFERGYELDQRDFMRVLLACYRARSGKAEEARAVLRTVRPTPPLYYNLACTHALLGEPETALDLLRRELDENHPAPGSRRRQQGWAREDPDLASLRGDPRFVELCGG